MNILAKMIYTNELKITEFYTGNYTYETKRAVFWDSSKLYKHYVMYCREHGLESSYRAFRRELEVVHRIAIKFTFTLRSDFRKRMLISYRIRQIKNFYEIADAIENSPYFPTFTVEEFYDCLDVDNKCDFFAAAILASYQ